VGAKARIALSRGALASIVAAIVGADPAQGVEASGNTGGEGRVRPFGWVRHVAMPHRIEVDVVEVSGEVTVVADCVFPIATLPYPSLYLGRAAGGDSFERV